MSQDNTVHINENQVNQVRRILFYELSINSIPNLELMIEFILKTFRHLLGKGFVYLSKDDLYKIMYPFSQTQNQKIDIESALFNLHQKKVISLSEQTQYINYLKK